MIIMDFEKTIYKILLTLFVGKYPQSFSQIYESIPSISEESLITNLKRLRELNLIESEQINESSLLYSLKMKAYQLLELKQYIK